MRYTKWFASFALAAGMALAGTSAASAQGFRDLRHDYNRVDWLRAAVARDRARLNEDMRYGRRWAAQRDREELMRHEAELRAQYRDVRHDYRGYDRNWR
jgi:hypothetical protein